MTVGIDDLRRGELAGNLAAVRQRIAAACARTGRDPAQVTLVAVTKTYPVTDVLHLAALGVTDIGENRDQEAAAKAAAVVATGVEVRWHFVGQLQRRRCRSVARYADLVHSLDRVRVAEALAEAAQRYRDRPLDVLVQVSLDGDLARGGAIPEGPEAERRLGDVLDTVAGGSVAGGSGLRLCGVMAVAPMQWEPERAFARLAEVAADVRAKHPGATLISAGMSGDIEQAIDYGATHVRIGSALLGNR